MRLVKDHIARLVSGDEPATIMLPAEFPGAIGEKSVRHHVGVEWVHLFILRKTVDLGFCRESLLDLLTKGVACLAYVSLNILATDF